MRGLQKKLGFWFCGPGRIELQASSGRTYEGGSPEAPIQPNIPACARVLASSTVRKYLRNATRLRLVRYPNFSSVATSSRAVFSRRGKVQMVTFIPCVPEAATRRLARARSGAFNSPVVLGSAV